MRYVEVAVADLRRASEWWGSLLGLKEVRPFEEWSDLDLTDGKDLTIHLRLTGRCVDDGLVLPTGEMGVGFEVEDFDAVEEWLEVHDRSLVEGVFGSAVDLTLRDTGRVPERWILLQSPDGHLVRLLEKHPPVQEDPMATRNDSRLVRDEIYRHFAATGSAPSPGQIAQAIRMRLGAVHGHLRALAAAHAIVLVEAGDAIAMAHPFAARSMGFSLAAADPADGRRWWGGCAWDSFGISAALGIDVRVDTWCPHSGERLSFVTGPGTPPPVEYVVRFPKPAAQWWDDVIDTCGNIRLFRSHEDAESWTHGHAPGAGQLVPATVVWGLAKDWYGDRLNSDFMPHSVATNQALLAKWGLVGEFWRLPVGSD